MIAIDKELIQVLFDKALVNPRLREGYDLRNSKDEGCQRMLLALMSRTVVPIHRHPHSNKNVVVVCGKMAYVLYDDNAQEIERILLDPAVGQYGCDISANAWHTVEVMEPTIMYEAKAGFMFNDIYRIIASYIIDYYRQEVVLEVADLISSIEDENLVQNIIEISQLGLPKLKDTKAIDDYIETIKEKTVMVKKEELTKALADTFDPKQKAQILKEIIALKDKE